MFVLKALGAVAERNRNISTVSFYNVRALGGMKPVTFLFFCLND